MSEKNKLTVFDSFAEESAVAIEMRRLYSRMRQKIRGSSMKAFMLTSATMNEGKSTVSSFLAMTAARHKKTKTIIVDADLRKSSIHHYFGMSRERGLSDCLSGDRSILDCIHDTGFDSLKVMPAGRFEAAPSFLFETSRVGEVFSELKFLFDMVIVDCPPVLPVSDPVLLVPEMDGVLLVIMAGVTPRELVTRARDVLQDVDANMLGVVVNNHAEVLPYYYGQKYYGYRNVDAVEARVVPAQKPVETEAKPVPTGAGKDPRSKS